MSSLRRRALSAGLLAASVVIIAAGCQPEPASSPAPSTSSAAPSASAPSPTGSASAAPGDALALPTACEQIYSPEMLAQLQADLPPLNDPGTTMLSSENAVALDILASSTQTIRCSWGPPSERGIATNVTIITPEQRDELFTAFEQAGFSAEDLGAGTIHRIEQQVITLDDVPITLGETHYLNGDGWVSTRWIDANPEGYTEDIAASLWG